MKFEEILIGVNQKVILYKSLCGSCGARNYPTLVILQGPQKLIELHSTMLKGSCSAKKGTN